MMTADTDTAAAQNQPDLRSIDDASLLIADRP